ncbi:MAG TPA: histone deacetylase [bacterium]|nr:histone deacetylase [bacterium]
MVATAVVWDSRYTFHEMGYLHPETPRRLISIKEVLDGDGVGKVLARLESRQADDLELCWVHDENYVRRIKNTAGIEMTALDPDTSANAYTWEAAVFAAGGFLRCCEEVLGARAKNAFALVRPPGHHAEHARAMGFCFFNNVAIGAEWLRKVGGLERVAIVDFDVHHCNGTQHTFYKRGDVFVSSIHRYPFYPGTGAADERGEGDGAGATLNVPLEAGADDDDYKRALCDVIVPAVEKFAPQMILVSAGYDPHRDDPLGGMQVSTAGFGWIMETLVSLAKATCGGKLAVTLEGGYNIKAQRDAVEAQLEVMAGA